MIISILFRTGSPYNRRPNKPKPKTSKAKYNGGAHKAMCGLMHMNMP